MKFKVKMSLVVEVITIVDEDSYHPGITADEILKIEKDQIESEPIFLIDLYNLDVEKGRSEGDPCITCASHSTECQQGAKPGCGREYEYGQYAPAGDKFDVLVEVTPQD